MRTIRKQFIKTAVPFLLIIAMIAGMMTSMAGTANAASITITYDLNGGTVSPTDSTKQVKVTMTAGGYTTIKSSSYYYPGKSIIGWSTSRGGSIKYYPGQVGVQFKSSTTLYAVWGNPDCKITYNPNVGGTVKNGPDKQSFKAGTLVKIAPPDMVKDGCTLLGFSTSKTSTKVDYKKGDSVRLYYSTTLYAVWRGTITYNAGIGGSVQQGPTQQTFITGTSVTLSPPNMYKKGYTLLGYSTNKNATKADYFSGKKYTFNSCVTLYAIWLPIYSVEVYSSKTATTPDKTYSIDSGTNLSAVLNKYSSNKPGYHYEWSTKDGKSVSGSTKVTSSLKIYPTEVKNTGNVTLHLRIGNDEQVFKTTITSGETVNDVITRVAQQCVKTHQTINLPANSNAKNGYFTLGFSYYENWAKGIFSISDPITVSTNGSNIDIYNVTFAKGTNTTVTFNLTSKNDLEYINAILQKQKDNATIDQSNNTKAQIVVSAAGVVTTLTLSVVTVGVGGIILAGFSTGMASLLFTMNGNLCRMEKDAQDELSAYAKIVSQYAANGNPISLEVTFSIPEDCFSSNQIKITKLHVQP